MSIYTSIPAYTYKITFIPTGQFYYGYREANIKANLLPEEDLWIHYFTSSNDIKNLRLSSDDSCFLTEIIYKSSPDEAYWFEQLQIKLHCNNPLILNHHYIDPESGKKKAFKSTPASAKKARQTMRERGTDKIGAANGQATMKKNGTHKIGREKFKITVNSSGVLKQAAVKQWETRWQTGVDNTKLWEVISPCGIVSIIRNMAKFCRENGLANSAMTGVANGSCKQHHGWRCKILESPPPNII